MNDVQSLHANEYFNENDEVASFAIDEKHKDVNSLQEKKKYRHIFLTKKFQFACKDDNQKNHVEKKEDLHYVPEAEEEQPLSIKI